MVEWIVKRAQGDRARVGTLTGVVCILANVALCAAKGVIGVLSGSVSIVADAMNNLFCDLAPAGLAVTSYHAAYGMFAGNTGYDEQGHLLLAEDPRNKERKKK